MRVDQISVFLHSQYALCEVAYILAFSACALKVITRTILSLISNFLFSSNLDSPYVLPLHLEAISVTMFGVINIYFCCLSIRCQVHREYILILLILFHAGLGHQFLSVTKQILMKIKFLMLDLLTWFYTNL